MRCYCRLGRVVDSGRSCAVTAQVPYCVRRLRSKGLDPLLVCFGTEGVLSLRAIFVMLYSSQPFIAWLAPSILHVFDQKFLRAHGFKIRPVANTIYSGESE